MGLPDKQLFYKGDNFKKWYKDKGYSEIEDFLREYAGSETTRSKGRKRLSKEHKFKVNQAAFHKNYEREQRWAERINAWGFISKHFEKQLKKYGPPKDL